MWADGSAVEHFPHTEGVTGSNPVSPTIRILQKIVSLNIIHLAGSWCSGLTRWPVTPETVGSNPIDPASLMKMRDKSGSSSGVEHCLAKAGVAGSNPVFRSIFILGSFSLGAGVAQG